MRPGQVRPGILVDRGQAGVGLDRFNEAGAGSPRNTVWIEVLTEPERPQASMRPGQVRPGIPDWQCHPHSHTRELQ